MDGSYLVTNLRRLFILVLNININSRLNKTYFLRWLHVPLLARKKLVEMICLECCSVCRNRPATSDVHVRSIRQL